MGPGSGLQPDGCPGTATKMRQALIPSNKGYLCWENQNAVPIAVAAATPRMPRLETLHSANRFNRMKRLAMLDEAANSCQFQDLQQCSWR